MRDCPSINSGTALRPDSYRGLRDQIGKARLERLKEIEGDWKCEIALRPDSYRGLRDQIGKKIEEDWKCKIGKIEED
jgi:hypothetical protein